MDKPRFHPPTPLVTTDQVLHPTRHDAWSVAESRNALIERLDAAPNAAQRCDCCHGTVKLYRRWLYGTQVRWLRDIVSRFNGQDPLHYSRGVPKHAATRDYSKLEPWCFIRPAKKAGYWYPTHEGIGFVEGRLMVPDSIYLLFNQPRFFADTFTDYAKAEARKSSAAYE